jgi:hypothetical protein
VALDVCVPILAKHHGYVVVIFLFLSGFFTGYVVSRSVIIKVFISKKSMKCLNAFALAQTSNIEIFSDNKSVLLSLSIC